MRALILAYLVSPAAKMRKQADAQVALCPTFVDILADLTRLPAGHVPASCRHQSSTAARYQFTRIIRRFDGRPKCVNVARRYIAGDGNFDAIVFEIEGLYLGSGCDRRSSARVPHSQARKPQCPTDYSCYAFRTVAISSIPGRPLCLFGHLRLQPDLDKAADGFRAGKVGLLLFFYPRIQRRDPIIQHSDADIVPVPVVTGRLWF